MGDAVPEEVGTGPKSVRFRLDKYLGGPAYLAGNVTGQQVQLAVARRDLGLVDVLRAV
jgi:hypothetical protein